MKTAEILDLHRSLVAIPSVSHGEGPICDWLETWFRDRGLECSRFGNNVWARTGTGPVVCLNTHLDTVPAGGAWTRPPHDVFVAEGRVFGLGSNDAKASAAAMLAAFANLARRGPELGVTLLLTLVCDEETGGKGTEILLPELRRRGLVPVAAIVGEPTGLDIAVAQKGLLVIELIARGRACHAAHGRALGAPNAVRELARDIVRLETLRVGPDHAELGPVTIEPVIVAGGTAKNMIPAEATCYFDLRTNPEPGHDAIVETVRAHVKSDVRVVSSRLKSQSVDPGERIVRAARRARPDAAIFGSRGVSDLVFFDGVPAIKVGPGATERSHTPDEFVYEVEILEGARFYEDTILAFAALNAGETSHGAALGSR